MKTFYEVKTVDNTNTSSQDCQFFYEVESDAEAHAARWFREVGGDYEECLAQLRRDESPGLPSSAHLGSRYHVFITRKYMQAWMVEPA